MPVLLNSAGLPEPSPEVQRRLQAVDPHLKLQFVKGAGPSWAVSMRWHANDERWKRVQDGRADPNRAFDIIGYLPMDCGVDEAPAYLVRMLRDYPKQEVQNMVERVAQWNKQDAGKAEVEQAVAEILDSPDPSQQKKRGRPRKGA